jgi:adenylylsulfate kinase
MSQGFTLWFTGLSGAGKTTLAQAVASELEACNRRVEVLDGDEVRASVNRHLGYEKVDRDRHVLLLGYVSSLLSKHGVIAIVAAISPYEAARRQVRTSQRAPFIETYLEANLETLIRRDVKGLYARALRGEIKNFSGISDPYEPPASPEIHLRTDVVSVGGCVRSVMEYLERQRFIDPRQ